MATDVLTLTDGRRVEVHTVVEGAPGAGTVVLCHAAPGSGGFDPDPESTWDRGVTLLSVDRPGYGGSDPVRGEEWATVSRAADDLAEVLDRREIGPVGVAGWSAGGRVAMALAARRPDLVRRVAVLCTPAPDDEVPWIPPPQRDGLEALRDLPAARAHEVLAEQLAPVASAGLGVLGAAEADAAALDRPGARDRLVAMIAEAFAQGAAGLAADIAGYCLRPWGFDPAEVRASTLLLYGADDPVVGAGHAQWYLARLPRAHHEQVPGAGHLLVIPMWRRVLSHLSTGPARAAAT